MLPGSWAYVSAGAISRTFIVVSWDIHLDLCSVLRNSFCKLQLSGRALSIALYVPLPIGCTPYYLVMWFWRSGLFEVTTAVRVWATIFRWAWAAMDPWTGSRRHCFCSNLCHTYCQGRSLPYSVGDFRLFIPLCMKTPFYCRASIYWKPSTLGGLLISLSRRR